MDTSKEGARGMEKKVFKFNLNQFNAHNSIIILPGTFALNEKKV